MKQTQVAVIGGGIVGLAHALVAAKTGAQVTLFERTNAAVGASIRNFGLIWPIGQRSGAMFQRAMRARSLWQEVIEGAQLWSAPTGSLHLAYHADEWAVLEEFLATFPEAHDHCELLTPSQVATQSGAVQLDGLIGALWSDTEINVDPRQAIALLPSFLAEHYGVELQYGTTVMGIHDHVVETPYERWQADRIFVCSGNDFETLYPREFAASNITRCKLQMLRTVPQPNQWQLGASLCAGLTLLHYASFAHCTSLAALRTRVQRDMPFYADEGIHVLLSQTALGELTIGDHHQYGLSLDPFARESVDNAIMEYLRTFAHVPTLEIAERWIGVYPLIKGKTELVLQPEPDVTIVNALGGAGMTLSFGLAHEIIHEHFSGVTA